MGLTAAAYLLLLWHSIPGDVLLQSQGILEVAEKLSRTTSLSPLVDNTHQC